MHGVTHIKEIVSISLEVPRVRHFAFCYERRQAEKEYGVSEE
jgi:hypothetical protein